MIFFYNLGACLFFSDRYTVITMVIHGERISSYMAAVPLCPGLSMIQGTQGQQETE